MNHDIPEEIKKRALGYEVTESTEEYVCVEGEMRLQKQKIVTKHLPPDIQALKLLIELGGLKTLAKQSDEELAAEEQALMQELKKKYLPRLLALARREQANAQADDEAGSGAKTANSAQFEATQDIVTDANGEEATPTNVEICQHTDIESPRNANDAEIESKESAATDIEVKQNATSNAVAPLQKTTSNAKTKVKTTQTTNSEGDKGKTAAKTSKQKEQSQGKLTKAEGGDARSPPFGQGS